MPSEQELAIADGVGSALIRLVRLIERKRDQYQAEHPDAVERATYLLLVHLVKDGPRRAGALAEAVHSDPSTISRQIGQPRAAGLRRAHRRPGGRPGHAARRHRRGPPGVRGEPPAAQPEPGRAAGGLVGRRPAGAARAARALRRRPGERRPAATSDGDAPRAGGQRAGRAQAHVRRGPLAWPSAVAAARAPLAGVLARAARTP